MDVILKKHYGQIDQAKDLIHGGNLIKVGKAPEYVIGKNETTGSIWDACQPIKHSDVSELIANLHEMNCERLFIYNIEVESWFVLENGSRKLEEIK